jgi:hypothetical protein
MKKIKILYFIISIIAFVNAESQIEIKSNETISQYKSRMEKYFNAAKVLSDSSKYKSEGSEYNEYKKNLSFWEPRLLKNNSVNKYFNAEYSFYSTRSNKSVVDEPWYEIGPKSNPVNYYGIGPIEFISFFDNGTYESTDRMLAGSVLGGLFYSTNHGDIWNKTGSDTKWPRSGCGWAIFHPTDYKIWFASSSGNSEGQSSWIGKTGGIFITYDEGSTWKQIANYNDLGGEWTIIYKIIVDPLEAKRLIIATSDGIYKTEDCYTPNPVWQKKLDGYVYDLEMKPVLNGSHNTFYASVCKGLNWKIWITMDYGYTWTAITTQPSSVTVPNISVRNTNITIEVSKAKPDYLYCLVEINNIGHLYYYDFNGPAVWNNVNMSFPVTMGWGHGFGVDQINGNDIYYSTSTNAKKIDITNTLQSQIAITHCDVEDIISNPYNEGEMFFAQHGGIDLSKNHGITSVSKSDGLGVANVFRMATSYSVPDYILIGLYHDGTIMTNSPYQANWNPLWKQIHECDGMRPLIDNINANFMWVSCQDNYWIRTEDYFQNTKPIENFAGGWTTEGVLNKINPAIFYRIKSDNKIYRSLNRGIVGTNFDITSNLYSILNSSNILLWQLFTPYSSDKYLYATLFKYSSPDNIWSLVRTKNANDSPGNIVWEKLTIPRIINCWISSVNFDYENPEIIYLVYGCSSDESNWPNAKEMIFKIDYTNSITNPIIINLTKNLPYVFAGSDCIAVEKNSNEGLYLATDFGVFYTNKNLLNSNDGWLTFGTELPHVRSNGIEINYQINKIRIGTYGRGAWEHSLFCPEEYDITETGVYNSNKFIESNHNINSDAIVNSGMKVIYRAGNVITLSSGFKAANGAKFRAFIKPCN